MTGARAWLTAAALLSLAAPAAALDPAQSIAHYARQTWTRRDGLDGDDVLAIGQAKDGMLWLGGSTGLWQLDGVRFAPVGGEPARVLGSWVRSASRDNEGALWIGGEHGLFRVDGKERRTFSAKDGLPDILLRALRPARRGGVWVGTNGHGFFRIDGRGAIEHPAPSPIDDTKVTALLEDDRALWVATLERGVYRYDGGDVARAPVHVGDELRSRSLGEDARGVLYVGHQHGLARLDGDHFTLIPAGGTTPIDSFQLDRHGSLWIGTMTGILRLRADGTIEQPPRGDPLATVETSQIVEDDDGGIVVATMSGVVVRLHDTPFTVYSAEELGVGNVGGLCGLAGRDLLFGSNRCLMRFSGGKVTPVGGCLQNVDTCEIADGVLWLGGVGFYRLDGDVATPMPFPTDDGSIYTMLPRPGGGLWIGRGRRLWSRDPDGTTRVILESPPGDSDIGELASDGGHGLLVDTGGRVLHIVDGKSEAVGAGHAWRSLSPDEAGGVWLGDDSGGIAHWQSGVLLGPRHFSGVADPYLLFVAGDGTGHVWLGSRRGVARVERAALLDALAGSGAIAPQLFDADDGIALPTFPGSDGALLAADGTLWLTGQHGLNHVDLGKLRPNARPLEALVEATPAERHGTYDFSWTAPTLDSPRRLRFRYRLDDGAWIEAGTRRAVRWADLAPGEHRFAVMAVRDGVAGAPGSLAFAIAPRWYQRRLVQLALALSALALAWLWQRRRVQRLAEQARTLTAEVHARTLELGDRNQRLKSQTEELQATLETLRLTQVELVRSERMASVAALVRGIAHELNNPIGFIAANVGPLRRYATFLEGLGARLAAGPPAADEWRALTHYRPDKGLDWVTADLARLSDDIAEGARRAALIVGDLQHLTSEPSRRLEQLDVARMVERTLALFRARLPQLTLEGELAAVPPLWSYAGALEQALTNLLDNAARAQPLDGTVRVRLAAHSSSLELSVIDLGVGMPDEVRRRATEPFFTTRAAGEGSGLGLSIVNAIVTAHKGTLHIDSAPDRGTTVSITLPLTGLRPE